MKPHSKFRSWCRDIWLDNCEELRSYNQLPYTLEEYFQKYKYWLKREFQYQMKTSASSEPNPAIGMILDDKFDSTGVRLLSDNQNKLIKTLKDDNEK